MPWLVLVTGLSFGFRISTSINCYTKLHKNVKTGRLRAQMFTAVYVCCEGKVGFYAAHTCKWGWKSVMKNNILLDVHDFPRIPKAGENQRLAYSSAQGVIDRGLPDTPISFKIETLLIFKCVKKYIYILLQRCIHNYYKRLFCWPSWDEDLGVCFIKKKVHIGDLIWWSMATQHLSHFTMTFKTLNMTFVKCNIV